MLCTQVEEKWKKAGSIQMSDRYNWLHCLQAISIAECAMFYLFFSNILFTSVSHSGGKGSSIVQNGGRCV